MSQQPSLVRKIIQHLLNVLIVVLVGANIWWFFIRDTRPQHPLTDRPAPHFTLPVLEPNGEVNGTIDLNDHKGKVVLLDFWATYCKPCKRQMPIIEKLHKELPKEQFTAISINIDRGPYVRRKRNVSNYLQTEGYSFPVALEQGKLMQTYRVERIPTLVIINPEGEIDYVRTGLSSEQTLRKQIDRLLAQASR